MARADVLDDPRADQAEAGAASRTSHRLWQQRRHLGLAVGVSAVVIALAALGTATTGSTDPAPSTAPPGQGSPVNPPPAEPETPATLFDADKRDLAMQLVSSAENSSLDWRAQYGYIEWNVEGVAAENRGYTAGLIGFCSACGDMTALLEHYSTLAPGNVLEQYLPAVRREQERGIGRATQNGLGRAFEAAWWAAATDPLFRQAQDHRIDVGYFRPAVEQAIADGLPVLGQFAYFDAMVMHGPGDSPYSFGGIRATALRAAPAPAAGGDTEAYLDAFLDARVAAMRTEVAHRDTSRVDTAQRRFLEQGNLALDTPLAWSVYGDRYTVRSLGVRPVVR
ncbi:chitosanase [Modestobacter lapidis]